MSFLKSIIRATPFIGARDPLVTVVDLRGVIGAGSFGRAALNLAGVEPAIEAAFRPSKLAAVALVVNSPGGSPVQSNLIRQAIRREADKKKAPVIAFVEDAAASGGYLIALAADEIYADASSIIGSIGVISAGFGFQDAIARLGVERRVHTSTPDKSQLDPFRPEKAEDVARLNDLLDALHLKFVDLVRSSRGARLAAGEDHFTGAFWAGEEALRRGLVDGIAHIGDFLPQRFGEDVRVRKVSSRPSLLRRLAGGSAGASARAVEAVFDTLEERAHWARLGF